MRNDAPWFPGKWLACGLAFTLLSGCLTGQTAPAVSIERSGDAFVVKWSARQDLFYQPVRSTDLGAWTAFGPTRETALAVEEMTAAVPREFIDANPKAFFSVVETPVGYIDGLTIQAPGTDGSVTRTYDLYIPGQFINRPVVFLFHGHGSSSDELMGRGGQTAPYKAWITLAQQNDLILVIPDGLNTSAIDGRKGWNDCRSDAVGNSIQDDVGFIRVLLDRILGGYKADRGRVYANGTSNGGHFCIRLAQEMPDRLAAFAAIVSANPASPKPECPDSTVPISALFMNGTADPLMPYNGGSMAEGRGTVRSTADTITYWVQRNQTGTTPTILNLPNIDTGDNCTVTKRTFTGGTNGTEVVLFTVANGGHADPSKVEKYSSTVRAFLGNQNWDIEMATEVWAFFQGKSRT